MTSERRTTRANAPSAGMPGGDPTAEGDRLAELEARLARLESSTGLRERGRDLMGRVAPPEAGRHFRNAGREQLLGIRSIVDFWIRRIELAEERSDVAGASRETIHID
ncbi:MAG TPA: hypothetical protein VKR24_03545 [Candidatus Limnocylindrales bacterium]|nr:hypothetical protein [Candidatus Limnocylindrales bacterium]